MSNLNVQIALNKLNQCKIIKIGGVSYVGIPIEANYLYKGDKGIYMNLTAYEYHQELIKDNYLLKLKVPKNIYEQMNEVEKKNLNIVGDIHPIPTFDEKKENVINEEVTEIEDLPF